jgi:hypothetical protein
MAGGLVGMALALGLVASDHDDGEIDAKGRSLALTDLYVFRESDQNGSASANDLILVMNTNPRSLPQQQYFFSTQARYEFHATRNTAAEKTTRPSGRKDFTLRFTFGAPTANQQAITVTAIKDGATIEQTKTTSGTNIVTTPLPGTSEVVNLVDLGGTTIAVFAGLREDPFFFDVKRYFEIRSAVAAGTAGANLAGGFNIEAEAEDFAKDYNVNSIVVRVPISFIQASNDQVVLDWWETISIPQ